jgi:hypothetical protein
VRLADALGTASAEFVESSLHQLIQAVSHCDMPEGGSEMELNAALALIESIRPANEVQAALGLQMAATHRLAMAMMGRLRRDMTKSNATVYGGLATKLLRAFAAQFEVLDRLRRGGQQTVRVEHVTVQAGGQAIVGHVETTGGGGLKSEEQPHAIAYAPGVEMPSPDPERSTVSGASDAEQPVLTARGMSPGAPKGNQNAFKHGRYTAEAIASRREIARLLRAMNDLTRPMREGASATPMKAELCDQ